MARERLIRDTAAFASTASSPSAAAVDPQRIFAVPGLDLAHPTIMDAYAKSSVAAAIVKAHAAIDAAVGGKGTGILDVLVLNGSFYRAQETQKSKLGGRCWQREKCAPSRSNLPHNSIVFGRWLL